MKRIFGLIILLLITYNLSLAQEYRAAAVLDSNSILIGDQIHVDFTLTMPQNGIVIFPALTQESLNNYGIDLVSSGAIDTTLSGQSVSYHQQWTITAFDSGAYIFPSIAVLSPDSLLLAQSQPLPFFVNTVAVDTTAAIRDIKKIARVPLTFKEILPYLLIGLAAAAVLALLVWFILKHERKNKPQKKVVKKTKPKEKPHIIALKELEKLKIRKLWQNGQIKQYYSELTDILRTYIDGRYDINAMEMITADILKELDEKGLPQELHKELEQTLTIADLVKFAKMEPLPDDHDRCFKQAVEFVRETADRGQGSGDSDQKTKN